MWYFFNSFQSPLPWSQCPLNENKTGTEKSMSTLTKPTHAMMLCWWLCHSDFDLWAVFPLFIALPFNTLGMAEIFGCSCVVLFRLCVRVRSKLPSGLLLVQRDPERHGNHRPVWWYAVVDDPSTSVCLGRALRLGNQRHWDNRKGTLTSPYTLFFLLCLHVNTKSRLWILSEDNHPITI